MGDDRSARQARKRASTLPKDTNVLLDENGAITSDVACHACDYSLRGLSGDIVRCPECGHQNPLGVLALSVDDRNTREWNGLFLPGGSAGFALLAVWITFPARQCVDEAAWFAWGIVAGSIAVSVALFGRFVQLTNFTIARRVFFRMFFVDALLIYAFLGMGFSPVCLIYAAFVYAAFFGTTGVLALFAAGRLIRASIRLITPHMGQLLPRQETRDKP